MDAIHVNTALCINPLSIAVKKKKFKKAKQLSEEVLQTAEERREAKSKGERERYIQLNAELQRIARREKKTFNEQRKDIDENNRMGKTRDQENLEISSEHFMQEWA